MFTHMHRMEMRRETSKFFFLGNFRYHAELINLETQNINVKLIIILNI